MIVFCVFFYGTRLPCYTVIILCTFDVLTAYEDNFAGYILNTYCNPSKIIAFIIAIEIAGGGTLRSNGKCSNENAIMDIDLLEYDLIG